MNGSINALGTALAISKGPSVVDAIERAIAQDASMPWSGVVVEGYSTTWIRGETILKFHHPLEWSLVYLDKWSIETPSGSCEVERNEIGLDPDVAIRSMLSELRSELATAQVAAKGDANLRSRVDVSRHRERRCAPSTDLLLWARTLVDPEARHAAIGIDAICGSAHARPRVVLSWEGDLDAKEADRSTELGRFVVPRPPRIAIFTRTANRKKGRPASSKLALTRSLDHFELPALDAMEALRYEADLRRAMIDAGRNPHR